MRSAAEVTARCPSSPVSTSRWPGPQLQPEAPQKEALHRWEHETGFIRGKAVEFTAETIAANPREVVLLSIGPLTNVATLFASHPRVPPLLRGLVMMAGAFAVDAEGGARKEWNVLCDPLAAATVYATPVATHRSVGLNVTMQVRLPAEDVRSHCRDKRWGPALDMAEVWFRRRPVVTFHDPLAAASLFDDRILRWTRGHITVETKGTTAAARASNQQMTARMKLPSPSMPSASSSISSPWPAEAGRPMSKVVVLGSQNMDLLIETPRPAGPGETREGTRFYTSPGGKG